MTPTGRFAWRFMSVGAFFLSDVRFVLVYLGVYQSILRMNDNMNSYAVCNCTALVEWGLVRATPSPTADSDT